MKISYAILVGVVLMFVLGTLAIIVFAPHEYCYQWNGEVCYVH